MPDDTTQRGPADAKRINVSEPWELDYWCKALGVSPDELKVAVRDVGHMADDVKRRLGK